MPTTEQLKEMAGHVQYEVDEFRKAIRDLPGLRGRPTWNRALESAVLHFRILRAFFFDERGRGNDDVFASHYCEPNGWQPKRDPVFNSTKRDVDKRLAHLTLERLTAKNWSELDQMSAAIERLVADFRKALRKPQVEWFPRLQAETVAVAIDTAGNRTDSHLIYPAWQL